MSIIKIKLFYVLRKEGFIMNKKFFLIYLIVFIICSSLLTGCNNTASEEKLSTNEQTIGNTAKNGDGTILVSTNISNPEQKQEKYNLIFAPASSFKTGEPIRNFKSYTVGTGTQLTVNISDLYMYFETDGSGLFKVGLTAARLEDVNVRNPLSEIMVLTFPDIQTCTQGKNITLNMTDKPLTSLYPNGTLLVRIVDPEKQGGYVDFMYKSQANMTLKYGKGSSGPDFLVPFEAAEFKSKGIRDAILVITNGSNQQISEQVELNFDENGNCKQGQYIEMKVKR